MAKKQEKRTSDIISEFLNFTRTLKTDYEYHDAQVNEKDKESGDLMHQIELGTYKDGVKFLSAIRKVRKERRVHSDYVKSNQDFYKYITEDDCAKRFLRDMEQVLGKVRKQEKYVESQRSYTPRVRADLTIRTTKDETK